jgi:predicted RNA-binding protein with PUA-like domain
MKQFWLIKSEPFDYSIDDLQRDGMEPWTGVRNYQARNFMRDGMKMGDLVLFYHSSTTPPGVVGIAKVVSEPHADPRAFDSKDMDFDPKATPENPIWVAVDMGFVEKLPRQVTLEEMRQDPRLEGLRVTRQGNRLSVMPISEEHFEIIVKMARS